MAVASSSERGSGRVASVAICSLVDTRPGRRWILAGRPFSASPPATRYPRLRERTATTGPLGPVRGTAGGPTRGATRRTARRSAAPVSPGRRRSVREHPPGCYSRPAEAGTGTRRLSPAAATPGFAATASVPGPCRAGRGRRPLAAAWPGRRREPWRCGSAAAAGASSRCRTQRPGSPREAARGWLRARTGTRTGSLHLLPERGERAPRRTRPQ